MPTERPRPRPRPRPAARPSATSSNGSGAGPSTSNPIDRSSAADEDKLFLRPQRTVEQWKAIEQKEREIRKVTNAIELSDDGDDALLRKNNKKPKMNSGWANTNIRNLYASTDSSSNEHSEDDVDALQVLDSGTKVAGKRKRSRSKSITPPPPLPQYQLQNARRLVRQALQLEPRAVSPTWVGDDSLENITLDPELAKIAQEARTKRPEEKRGGGPEEVLIKVKWQPHPKDDAAHAPVPWGFKMKRHNDFKQLFEECADMAGVLSQSLVVSYKGKRIFPHVTPHSIHIWAEAELQACDKITHEYIRAHPRPGTNPINGETEGGADGTEDISDSDAEPCGSQGDTFKLVLRSRVTEKNITLVVRPTTTCGAIVKAFLKKAGLKSRKKGDGVSLMVDGDKMAAESEIAEADLDDGDMIEVVGL